MLQIFFPFFFFGPFLCIPVLNISHSERNGGAVIIVMTSETAVKIMIMITMITKILLLKVI